ncbi:hypothetical protein pb186bvf_017544 [Paramecium bursaria]
MLLQLLIDKLPQISEFLETQITESELKELFNNGIYEQMQGIEKKIIELSAVLNSKENIKESQQQRQLIQEQIYQTEQFILQKIDLKTDLLDHNRLDQLINDMQQIMNTKIDEAQLNKALNINNGKLFREYQQIFTLSGEFREYQQSVNDQLKFLELNIEKNHLTLQQDLDLQSQQIQDLNLQLQVKSSKAELSQVVEQLKRYSKKTDLLKLEQELDKYQISQSRQNQECINTIEDFRKLIKSIDYNLLYKASKMDLGMIEKAINEQNTNFQLFENKLQSHKQDLINLDSTIQNFNQENIKVLAKEAAIYMFQDLQQQIDNKFKSILIENNLQEKGNDILEIRNSLNQKANLNDLLTTFNQKANRSQIDLLIAQKNRMQNQLKLLKNTQLQSITLFSHILDDQITGMKRREINALIADLSQEQYVDQFNKTSFRQYDSVDNKIKIKKPVFKPLVFHQKLQESDYASYRRVKTHKSNSKSGDEY